MILFRFLTLGLITVLALALGRPAFADDMVRKALLIGQKDYRDEVGPLINPHKDVRLLEAALTEAGFEVTVLLDDVDAGIEIDRSDILSAVRRHGEAIGQSADAISFVYYSGHGATNRDDGRNYLIPQSIESVTTADMWDESVALETVIDRLRGNAPNAAHFLVFDACRNELKLSTGARALTKGFVPEKEEGGIFIAFSTSPEKVASDGEPNAPAGPYAQVLAEEIRQGGKRHDMLFTDVKLAVHDQTGQLPWERSGLARVVFLNANDGTVVERPAVTTERDAGGDDANGLVTTESEPEAPTPTTVSAEPPVLSMRKALIVSNEVYDGPFEPRPGAHFEGETVATSMQASGFDVLHLKDPSRTALFSEAIKMIDSFEGPADEKFAVLYFIGEVRALSDEVNLGLASGDTNYLIPAGVSVRSAFDLPIHGIEVRALAERAAEIDDLAALFVVDGCRPDATGTIPSTEPCVPEGERERIMVTINELAPPPEPPVSSSGPPGSGEPYVAALIKPAKPLSVTFSEAIKDGGSVDDMVKRVEIEQSRVGTGNLKVSGSLDTNDYQLRKVSPQDLSMAVPQQSQIDVPQYSALKVAPREQLSIAPDPVPVERAPSGAETVIPIRPKPEVQSQLPVRMGDVSATLEVGQGVCASAVQGKIAWDAAGRSMSWAQGNIVRLCEGRAESVAPARCFGQYMGYMRNRFPDGKGINWQDGITLCTGVTNSKARLTCVDRRLDEGLKPSAATKACSGV